MATEAAFQDPLRVVLGERQETVRQTFNMANLRPDLNAVLEGGPTSKPHAIVNRFLDEPKRLEDFQRAWRHTQRFTEIGALRRSLDHEVFNALALQFTS